MHKIRKISAILLALITGLSTCACGSSDDASSGKSSEPLNAYYEIEPVNYKAENFVTLGSYDHFTVQLDQSYKVTQKEIRKEVESQIGDTPEYLYTDKKKTEDGDIINIDMSYSVDGEAQSDYSLSETNIVLGEDYMGIDGFDDELTGKKVLGTYEFSLKFPEDYELDEFAGKTGDFTVVINGIMRTQKVTYDTLSDHYVQTTFGYDSLDEYMDEVKSTLQENKDSQKDAYVASAVIKELLKRSLVREIPDGLIDLRIKEYKNYYIYQANAQGISMDEYLKNENLTEKKWDKQLKTYMKDMVKKELIYMAVADKEGISDMEGNYETYRKGMMSSTGLSEKDFKKVYPDDYCRLLYNEQTVSDQLVANATVKPYKK